MKTVDFYFDFSSTNSYFATFLLPEICARHNAAVNWLPIHLASLFRGTGFDVMAMTPRKASYLWRDHARYAEITGLPFRRPSRFPIKTSTALRYVLAAGGAMPEKEQRARQQFSQAVFRSYWERDEDIANDAVLTKLASDAGFDAPRLLEKANSPGLREELSAITDRAIERGVFGAPTFFVGSEMFWGKDRLDFVEQLISR